jgi:hypothetical protein
MPSTIQYSGRLQTILSSAAPLLLVIPDEMPSQELSIALRAAQDLQSYHRIDTDIIFSAEALQRAFNDRLGSGNIVVIGAPRYPFARWIVSGSLDKTPFRVDGDYWKLEGRTFVEDGIGTTGPPYLPR